MRVEIEAKLKVDSLDKVAESLSKTGAEFVQQQRQTDSYFDDDRGTLKAADRALRVRRQATDKGEKVILCYKGPKAAEDLKKREEIECEVSDADSAELLLLRLGYKKELTFEKRRRVFRLEGCGVMLDELPLLGGFVEIEGPGGDEITNVQARLGLAELRHTADSYAELMAARLRELGASDSQIRFNTAQE